MCLKTVSNWSKQMCRGSTCNPFWGPCNCPCTYIRRCDGIHAFLHITNAAVSDANTRAADRPLPAPTPLKPCWRIALELFSHCSATTSPGSNPLLRSSRPTPRNCPVFASREIIFRFHGISAAHLPCSSPSQVYKPKSGHGKKVTTSHPPLLPHYWSDASPLRHRSFRLLDLPRAPLG